VIFCEMVSFLVIAVLILAEANPDFL